MDKSAIVLDVGKRTKKQIKALKKGKGSLAARVHAAVDQARPKTEGTDGKQYLPVVVIYRKDEKTKRRGFPMPRL